MTFIKYRSTNIFDVSLTIQFIEYNSDFRNCILNFELAEYNFR